MKFYLGTTNPYKVRELASILNPLGIPLEVTAPVDPDETGNTFEANAVIKALAYGEYVGEQVIRGAMRQSRREGRGCSERQAAEIALLGRNWVICEDSGIEVPHLGGLPGPWSARFDDCILDERERRVIGHVESGRPREHIDAANNARLLRMMEGVEQPHRAAAFTVCMVVADVRGKVLFATTRSAYGWLLPECRGQDGFGYDPIFASDRSFGKSWAEIDSMRKNLISHRRLALQDLTAWIAGQLKQESAR